MLSCICEPAFLDLSYDECLVASVTAGQAHTVESLLLEGACPNTRDLNGDTCLYIASELGFLNVVCLLLRFGAAVDARSGPKQNTALHAACGAGYAPVAAYLIDCGAEVDARNADLQTPLHIACVNGWQLLIQFLIGRGADIRSQDGGGQTPIDITNVVRLPPDAEGNIGLQPISDRQLRALFQRLGPDSTGFASREKVRDLYLKQEWFGVALSESEVDSLISSVTTRMDGGIHFHEFSEIWLRLTKL
eukprot:GGOE01021531.1.p1 GENE.GGOE01021531.1~~GGOE01021531.1.p1  ORF type:complete len:248 (+),score=54.51 GGOE01021531.1:27-770(+)